MRNTLIVPLGLAMLAACATTTDVTEPIPEPGSWSFPAVIESARKIAPQNIEGRNFDERGLAYPVAELDALKPSSVPPEELQKYADIVTYAYPDAVWRQVPLSCDVLPVEQLNTITIAGMAYVSLHAVRLETRNRVAACLSLI